LPNVTKREAPYGEIADLAKVDFDNDVVRPGFLET